MRSYVSGVQPLSSQPMGLLPRGAMFLDQTSPTEATSSPGSAVQINRMYVLEKDVRKLMRSEERLRTLKEAREATVVAALPSPPSPAAVEADAATTTAEGGFGATDGPILAPARRAKSSRSAKGHATTKPLREPRTTRKSIGTTSS